MWLPLKGVETLSREVRTWPAKRAGGVTVELSIILALGKGLSRYQLLLNNTKSLEFLVISNIVCIIVNTRTIVCFIIRKMTKQGLNSPPLLLPMNFETSACRNLIE